MHNNKIISSYNDSCSGSSIKIVAIIRIMMLICTDESAV